MNPRRRSQYWAATLRAGVTVASMFALAATALPGMAQDSSSVPATAKPAKKALPAFKRQAIGHMNAGRFKEAYDILHVNLAANADDADTRFMLAQCAARLNKPAEAASLYEAILARNPDLPRVRLELARAYMDMGERDKARQAFESVQASNPPPAVGENIQRFLSALDAQRPWQARLAVSYVYDSNVNSGPASISVLPGATDDGFTGQKDHAWGLTGNVAYTHRLPHEMAWQSEATLYSLDYASENASDQLIFSASTGPAWKMGDNIVSVPVVFDHVSVGHDFYSRSAGLAPQWRRALNQEYAVNAAVTLARREHRDSARDRDGTSYGASVGLRRQLAQGDFLQASLRLSDERTRQDYFDTTSLGLSLAWYTTLAPDWSLLLQPSLSRVRKGDVDPFYAPLVCSGCGQTQRDWQYQINASLSRKLDKQGSNLALGVSLTRNDSNIALTDYERTMVTLTLTKQF